MNNQKVLLISVILLLVDVFITYLFDADRFIALIPLAVSSILIYGLIIYKFKKTSLSYIALVSGLSSLLLAIIYFTNPASDSATVELSGYYAYYFGVVGYTMGFLSFFIKKDKVSSILSMIGIIAASPWILFASLFRYFG